MKLSIESTENQDTVKAYCTYKDGFILEISIPEVEDPLCENLKNLTISKIYENAFKNAKDYRSCNLLSYNISCTSRKVENVAAEITSTLILNSKECVVGDNLGGLKKLAFGKNSKVAHEFKKLHQGKISFLSTDQNNEYLITGCDDGIIRKISLKKGKDFGKVIDFTAISGMCIFPKILCFPGIWKFNGCTSMK